MLEHLTLLSEPFVDLGTIRGSGSSISLNHLVELADAAVTFGGLEDAVAFVALLLTAGALRILMALQVASGQMGLPACVTLDRLM